MENDRSIVLGIPELRLSMRVFGCDGWDDLPLLDTEEPVEQRMMNALLQLTRKACFLPQGEKFAPDREFSRLIRNIGCADEVYYLYADKYVVAILYEKGSVISVVSPDWGNREQCRISEFSGIAISEIQDQYSVLAGEHVKTELKQYRKPLSRQGKYNVEELGFFLGQYVDWEEKE